MSDSRMNRASPEIDEPLDPVEFGHKVHHDDCERLYKKILERALVDYFTRGVPAVPDKRRMHEAETAEAWDFLFSEDPEWKNHRELCCDYAGVDSDVFSEGVIKWRREKLNLG